jgi:mannose-1-phosphate guanylyltransferase
LIPTILCGGAGSRLWPVSRALYPKHFIRLSDGQSLLQKTWLRAAALPDTAEILTVTNRELLFQIRDEYHDAAVIAGKEIANSSILEPVARNTAPAIAAAALDVAQKHGKDSLLLVLPADHLIADQAAFGQAVAQATLLAVQGKLVTFGIRPDVPETGYGYIEADGSAVVRFVEKPTLEKAQEYVKSGRYLWNSGMFCFSAATMISEMEKHCPEVLSSVRGCLEKSRKAEGKGFSQIELDAETFGKAPDVSIDYAVMEKSKNVAVVPCSIGWNDIGSWSALGVLTEPDAKGNRIQGEAQLYDVSNCYIQSSGRVVAAVGVDNLAIIDTPDALLVADRGHTQDVRHLYAALKAQGNEAHKVHLTVHRPWGTYTILEEGPKFKIKRIKVKPKASLSLQSHQKRSEHWVVVSGTATVVVDERRYQVKENESTYVAAKSRHRLANEQDKDLVIIEVQSGDYLGEDDIVRFQDDYGRS